MRTSKSEQETIITYNAADERAQIYTCYPPMIRKLDKLAAERWMSGRYCGSKAPGRPILVLSDLSQSGATAGAAGN